MSGPRCCAEKAGFKSQCVCVLCAVQLPHIVKVLRSRNCEGVSVFSVAILLHSTSANVAYCINRNLPLR